MLGRHYFAQTSVQRIREAFWRKFFRHEVRNQPSSSELENQENPGLRDEGQLSLRSQSQEEGREAAKARVAQRRRLSRVRGGLLVAALN